MIRLKTVYRITNKINNLKNLQENQNKKIVMKMKLKSNIIKKKIYIKLIIIINKKKFQTIKKIIMKYLNRLYFNKTKKTQIINNI